MLFKQDLYDKIKDLELHGMPLLHIQSMNWRSIIYTSIILAFKCWDDRCIRFNKINEGIVDKTKIFDKQTTKKFENIYLTLIDF